MQPITYVCADDSTHSLRTLGKAHQRLCALPHPPSGTSLLLHTCQRIEWYTAVGAFPPAPELRGRTPVLGYRPALARLAQIAAGTRSLIPGERFIHRQVREAAAHLSPGHPLHQVTREALRLAERAREHFGLYADVDYSDLPRLLLDEPEADQSQLLVIGGGMLARAVAAAAPRSYERVVMMTRGPRKLRRLVEGLGNVTVVRHPSLDRALSGRPYDTVIATTNLNGEYRARVTAAITGPSSRRVIDLCATPALEDRPGHYVHLYDPSVLLLLESANKNMTERAAHARQWIAHHAEVRV